MLDLDLKNLDKFKGFFNLLKGKKRRSLGVDVSKNFIKIVELEKQKNHLFLRNYLIAKVNCDLTDFKNINNKKIINQNLGNIIANVLNKNNIESGELNLSVPSFTSLVTVFELPNVPNNQIEELIRSEAEKYIPLPLTDVVYDWQVIEEGASMPEGKGPLDNNKNLSGKEDAKSDFLKKKKIVLVAIIKDISYQFEKTMHAAKLKINSLEISSFSLVRSLIGNDNKNYLIFDIGDKICDINLVMNKNLVFHKNIDFAGNSLTESLSRALNISNERAEKIKIEEGLNIKNEDVKRLVYDPFLNVILEEARKAMKFLESNYLNGKIEAIILSGGTSQLPGLRDYLNKELNMGVYLGNPWSKIECPKGMEKHLLRLGPCLAIAVGLAMLDFIDD